MSIDLILNKIQSKLNNSPLFFLAPETERGLGLESDLSNYFVLSSSNDYAARELELADKGLGIETQGGSSKLENSPIILDYIKQKLKNQTGSIYFQILKPQENTLGQVLLANGINSTMLNNSAELTRSLENKIKQYQLLVDAGFTKNLPETTLDTLENVNLEEIRSKGLVVQLPFGHTGSSTYLPEQDSMSALEELKQNFPKRQCKLSKRIEGHPFTINACCYQDKVFVGGLSYQYTGIDSLTPMKSATVGNDWVLPSVLLSKLQIQEIYNLTVRIGNFLKTQAYKGMFGVDLLVSQSGEIYIIEINPRQTASVPMYTKLQLENDVLPLSAIHLCEFLDIEIDQNQDSYNLLTQEPIKAAQIFLRSHRTDEFSLPSTDIKPGLYRQMSDNSAREFLQRGEGDKIIFLDSTTDRPLIRQSEKLIYKRLPSDGFILHLKQPGSLVNYNQEIARIQIKSTLATLQNGQVSISPLAKDALFKISGILSI